MSSHITITVAELTAMLSAVAGGNSLPSHLKPRIKVSPVMQRVEQPVSIKLVEARPPSYFEKGRIKATLPVRQTLRTMSLYDRVAFTPGMWTDEPTLRRLTMRISGAIEALTKSQAAPGVRCNRWSTRTDRHNNQVVVTRMT